MKAISLHEPYASLILLEWKKIETRTHERLKSLAGQTIGIHATKEKRLVDDEGIRREVQSYMNQDQRDMFRGYYFNNHFGKLLGTVKVTNFRELEKEDSQLAMIDCKYTRRFGLFLEDPKWFENFFPYKGHQGIFTIPEEVMKQLYYKGARKDL